MQQKILSLALALCLCISVLPNAYAQDPPSPAQVYETLIALKETERFKEGTPWTDATHEYGPWKGGPVAGNITGGTGCAAFTFELSDIAFGDLPARTVTPIQLSNVLPGDILRVNGNTHSVIVLQVSESGVIIAEGNISINNSGGIVHWGRTLTKDEVEAATYHITRYPAGSVPPTDPGTDDLVDGGTGTLDGGLSWTLTKGGTLTISGNGPMPDCIAAANQPWNQFADKILKIVVDDGVTAIGSHAFHGNAVMSVTVPASVKTIGDSAFYGCRNLNSVTLSEGVTAIEGNAFRGCTALKSIALPASIERAGAGAFMDCNELTNVTFAPGSKTTSLGDNLFTQCYNLTTVTLPRNTDRIGAGMFQNCLMLSALTIPQGVTSIGEQAFASCGRLASLWIPDSVTRIETAAFSACASLADIHFGGDEAAWNRIEKIADVPQSLAGVTIHYNGTTTEPDPGHEHRWAAAWSYDGTNHWHECFAEDCDVVSNRDKDGYGAHSYGGWVTDREATAYQPGSRHRTCTVCGCEQTDTISATGDSSSSDHDSSGDDTPPITTTTTRNPDGSTTTTKTDRRTGTVTETTRHPDGSAATITTNAAGKVTVAVRLSAAAVSAAQQNGETVTLPIPKLQAVRSTGTAPTVTVNTGIAYPMKVKIPVDDPTPGTVAVILRANGREEIIKASVPMKDGVAVSLPDGATVKIVDNSKNFTDVSSQNWAADAICFVSARELFAGTSADAFTPEAPMTRAMLITVLARLDGADTTGGTTWYEKSMNWAIANGISDGSNPTGNITREQLAAMIWRYAGSPAATGDLSGFADLDQLSGFAQQAMRWAVENGIIHGLGAGQLSPQGQATRAQVAQILRNYIEM